MKHLYKSFEDETIGDHLQPADFTVDFDGLNQAHRRHLFIQLLNRIAIVFLIFAAGFTAGIFSGFSFSHQTQVTDEQVTKQLKELEFQQLKEAKEYVK